MKPVGEIFYLPGLYSVAELPDDESGGLQKRFTFALITGFVNELMKTIHNDGSNRSRMPLFLHLGLSRKWVESDQSDAWYREILFYDFPSERMAYWPVYTIRSPKEWPDGKDKDKAFEWKTSLSRVCAIPVNRQNNPK